MYLSILHSISFLSQLHRRNLVIVCTQNLSSNFFTTSKTIEKTEVFTKSLISSFSNFFFSTQKSQLLQLSQILAKSSSSPK
ncbi:MAG: hypothetical protein LBQ24_01150 [Candidatus Peribacteria bacterium]|nr:hypothetical protein [Candidatus Peribacteria bacterium]